MKNSFVGDVINSWVGLFVLRAVGDMARLSGVACGAVGGFPLRRGHRRLSFELERWAPLLESQLFRCPNREHEQYENGNEGRQFSSNNQKIQPLYTVERGGYLYP